MKRRFLIGCVLALLPTVGLLGCGEDTTTVPDTTPPLAPHLDGATLDNGVVGAWWQPNTEPDLAGYYVYWVADGVIHSGSTDPITSNYLVLDLNGISGPIDVYVTATDYSGNESSPSSSLRAANAVLDSGRQIINGRPKEF